MKKNNKKSILATAILTLFVSANAMAVTEQQALAQLDGASIQNAEARQTARTELSALISAGVPVDSAYEVVRSAVDNNFTSREIRKVSSEIREQIQSGISAEHVVKSADRAIDVGYSARSTIKSLDKFERRVKGGMPVADADALHANEVALNFGVTGSSSGNFGGHTSGSTHSMNRGTGSFSGSAMGSGHPMNNNSGNFSGSTMGSGTGVGAGMGSGAVSGGINTR